MTYKFTLTDGRIFYFHPDTLLSVNDATKVVKILWPGSKLKTCTRIK